jgi:hypothetical protein
MTIETRYIFTAAMDVEPDKEALFDDLYDNEHIPLLRQVPGVIAVARFKREQEFQMVMGGERLTLTLDDEPRQSAIYELASPDVLLSDAWAKAVDSGRWPDDIRPFTSNRRPTLRRRIYPA